MVFAYFTACAAFASLLDVSIAVNSSSHCVLIAGDYCFRGRPLLARVNFVVLSSRFLPVFIVSTVADCCLLWFFICLFNVFASSVRYFH